MARWHTNDFDLLPEQAFRPRGFGSWGGMTLEGGKGSKAPDPNPGMIRSAEASEKVGMRALDLQEEYMDWSKQFYEDLKPTIQAAYETETSIAKANQDRANEYADYERNTYRPIEQALVKQASEYNTEAKREELARAGAADVSQAFGVARDQQRRQLGAQGLRPDSGRFAALNQQLNLQEALSRAGVQNKARTDAENLGFARAMDVTGLGRNLATNASTAYGVALQGSGQSTNTAMTGGNFMNSAYGQGSNMLGQATNAYGQAGNIYGQEFNARMQGYNAQKQSQGDMFGAIGGVAGRIGAAYMTGGTSLALGGMADGGKVLGLRRYADGGPHEGAGPVSGPGGPVDDKIPAMLSNGEYVLPADTVKKVGVGRLDKLVKETHTPAAVQRKRKALKGKK